MMLFTTLVVSFLVCCGWRLGAARLEWCPGCGFKHESCYSQQTGYHSGLITPNLQPTATEERNDQCGNQHYSHSS